MNRRIFWSVPLIVYAMVIFLAACSPSSQPRVLVSSPSNGSEFGEGQIIPIKSLSTDSSGITRVEVFVDGFMYHTETLTKPLPEFSTTQNWQATAGFHIISVRAFNAAGVASEPVMLRVSIVPALNPLLDLTVIPDSPTPLSVGSPTMTPTVALTATATVPLPTSTPAALSIQTSSRGSLPASTGDSRSAPSNISSAIPDVAPSPVKPQPPANASAASLPSLSGGSPSQSSGNGGKNGNENGSGHAGGNALGKGPKNN